jgi:hypothetical protein
MKHKLQLSLLRGGALAVLALAASFGSLPAFAAGTLSGTTINNTATLSYSVGTVAQKDIGSSQTGNTSGAGTPTSFVVDTKVNVLVVTKDGTAISVVPGQKVAITTFTVTNTGNKAMDFGLSSGDVTGASQTVLSVTDNINVDGACKVDAGAGATKLTALAPDTPVDVTVSCAIPDTAVNADAALVYLKATALDSTGVAQKDTGSNDPTKEDIVLADAAGSDDLSRDASFSARSAYKVKTAALTVTKTFKSLCDPMNGPTNAANIPGAFVQYTVTITNGSTAGDSALLTTIKDDLSTNVTFDPNLIRGTTAASCTTAKGVPASVAGSGIKVVQADRGWAGPKYMTTDATDTDGAGVAAPADPTKASGTLSVDFTKILPAEGTYVAGELKKGESVQVIFNVQIN